MLLRQVGSLLASKRKQGEKTGQAYKCGADTTLKGQAQTADLVLDARMRFGL